MTDDKHQRKIMEDTLKMPDAMVAVMGGPSKIEAEKWLLNETTTTVARWESRSGKHWVDLQRDEWGYTYTSPGAMGSLGGDKQGVSEADALAYVQRLVDMGDYFQPAASKTPMKRTR